MTGPARPTSIARRSAARLTLVIVGVALACGVAEVALRVLGLYQTHPRTYVGQHQSEKSTNYALDSRLGWRMPAGGRFTVNEAGRDILYVADGDGFRIDPDRPAPAGPGRLVAVGDSFTFGTGVAAADSYPAVLAGLLGGWALTNAAQPGYGIDQVWQSVVLEAVPRAPDLIIAGIYPEDFERSLSAFRVHMNKPTFRLESGRLVPLTEADRPGPVTRFLEGYSRLFTLARQISVNAGFRYGIGEMWTLNAAMLDDMRRVSGEAHIPIVFVHIPPNTLDEFPALAAYMKKAGALFVDPLEAMKKQAEPLYLQGNMHLNAAGHRFIATQVDAFLRDHADVLRARASRPASAGPR